MLPLPCFPTNIAGQCTTITMHHHPIINVEKDGDRYVFLKRKSGRYYQVYKSGLTQTNQETRFIA